MGSSLKISKETWDYILTSKSTVCDDLETYENDPYFVEKGERAKKFLDRVGFPEDVLKIIEERQGKKNEEAS